MAGEALGNTGPLQARQDVIAQFREVIQQFTWKLVRIQSTHLTEIGLTSFQAFTLRALEHFGPDIDMATLSSLTSLPASSITSIVDRFQELGLVDRRRHEQDRRRVTASITDSGRDLVMHIDEQEGRILQDLLDGIHVGSIDVVTQVFRHLTDQLDQVQRPPRAEAG